MKYLVFISIAVLLQFNSLFSQDDRICGPDSIKGDFKICTTYSIDIDYNTNKETKRLLSENKYNKYGYKIELINYNMDSTVEDRTLFSYDSNFRVSNYIQKYYHDSLIWNVSFKYNLAGKMTEEVHYKNDTLVQKIIYIYDKNNNLLEINSHSDDGSQLFKGLFKYDDNNNIIKKTTFNYPDRPYTIEYIYSK